MAQDLKLQIMLRAVDKVTRPLKGVIKTAKTLNSQLTENATELRELRGLQKSISGYKKLQSQLGGTASSIDNTRRSLAEMGRTIAHTEKPTKRQLAQFDKAKRQLNTLKDAHQEQRTALLASANALRQSSIDVRRLSSEESKLAKRIDSVNNKMNQHGEQLDKVRHKQRLLTKAKNSYNRTLEKQAYLSVVGTAGYATGTTVLQSVKSMIQPGIEFESQMSKVSALTRMNKDSQEFQTLWQQAMQLGASTSFSASEAAAGMQFLAMAGFEVNEIYAAMPGVLSLAKASGNELAATADIASNILSGFKLEATDMNRVGDVLAATITRSNVTLDMLGETMKYVAPAAQKIGTSLEEASAMAGLLGDVGIQASMAGTVLRSLHTRLAAPPKAAKDALRQLSVQTMDIAGKMRPLPEILADIAKKTENLSNAKQLELFIDIAGQEAGTGFAELIERSGSGRIEEFANLLKQSGGEVAKISAQMSDNMAGDIKAMESAWSALQITLSTSNSAPIRELVQSVTGLINRVTEWTNQNPVLAAQMVKFVAIAGALVLGFGGLAITIASIVGPFAVMKYALSVVGIKSLGLLSGIKSLGTGLLTIAKTAVPFLGKAFVWLGRLFLMNPIGLVISAIAGSAYLLYQYWAPVKAFFNELWQSIRSAFSIGVELVKSSVANWSPLEDFSHAFSSVLDWFGITLPTSFNEMGGNLIDGMVSGITDKLSTAKEAITDTASSIVDWFKETLDIHSPSRVFAEMGGFISQGVGKGISAKAKHAILAISELGQQLTQSMSSDINMTVATASEIIHRDRMQFRPATRPASQPKQAPVQVSITYGEITIESHADNPRELVTLISQELDRRESQAAARIRSRLYDEE